MQPGDGLVGKTASRTHTQIIGLNFYAMQAIATNFKKKVFSRSDTYCSHSGYTDQATRDLAWIGSLNVSLKNRYLS